jgi:hypothetical protein
MNKQHGRLNRRLFLAGSVATTSIGSSQSRSEAQAAMMPLRLSPPSLSNPTTIEVTDDLLDSSPKDPSGRRELRLGPGDYILKLPTDRPLTRKLQVSGSQDGRDITRTPRHIVIIGGAVHPALNYDPATMRLLDGSDYALYTRLGFSGATGGTFRMRVREAASEPYTAPIPWDATSDDILAALKAVPGVDEDGAFAVEGKSQGGPWKIVPGNNSKLGRPVLDLEGLQGTPIESARTYYWNAALDSLWLKFWSGTVHLEGLDLGGPNGGDGIQIMNPLRDARLQIANVRSVSNFPTFHNDWLHLDGAQMYNGPSQLLVENTELRSTGFNAFIYQPNTVKSPIPVENLYAPWLRNVWIRSIKDDANGRSRDDSTALFIADGTRSRAEALIPMKWDMENVYVSRESLLDGHHITDDEDKRYLSRSGYPGQEQPGLFLRARQPIKDRPNPGLKYVSPGYLPPAPINLVLTQPYSP